MDKEILAKQYSKSQGYTPGLERAFLAGFEVRQPEFDEMQKTIDQMRETIKDLCRLTTNRK